METTVEQQEGSRVKVGVTVPAADVDQAINRAARGIARDMRLPGFRKGKAPPALVIQRVGFGPVLEDAIRESLPEWYMQAVNDSGIAPIGDPELACRGRWTLPGNVPQLGSQQPGRLVPLDADRDA